MSSVDHIEIYRMVIVRAEDLSLSVKENKVGGKVKGTIILKYFTVLPIIKHNVRKKWKN